MNNLSTRIKSALEAPMFNDVRRVSSMHPSAASIELSVPDDKGRNVTGGCHRQQYYKHVAEPVSNKVSPDVILSSMIGDEITEMVAEILDVHGFKCGLQRVVAENSFYIPEIQLNGRCDFIGYDHTNKEFIGIEVKSVGEWKAGKCIERPADEHIMQSFIYLDHYQTAYPSLMFKKWYILYVSRTENYTIKARKHGSPLTMIWDSYITIDPKDKCAVIHTHNGAEKWKDCTRDNLYNRYKKLLAYLNTNTIPPKDYEIQYSDERIVALYKTNGLTRKMDIEKVEKWLKKGAPPGKLKVEIGDGECNFCNYKATCWPDIVAKDVDPVSDIVIPKEESPKTNEAPWI